MTVGEGNVAASGNNESAGDSKGGVSGFGGDRGGVEVEERGGWSEEAGGDDDEVATVGVGSG